MRPGTDQAPTKHLLTVHEAAGELGLTVEAVRSRLKRGTLEREKAPDGTVYVVIKDENGRPGAAQAQPGTAQANDQASAQSLIVARLENEVEWLRREVERKDTIIMSLSEGLRALEAPSEPRETPVTASEDTDKGTTPPAQQQEPSQHPKRSWWRDFFGLK